MSLPEAPKSSPVVHHFYPIHPQTALQQQSAVYSTSDNPLVAPILSTPSQSSQNAHTRHHKKRKVQQVDSDIEYLGSRPSGSHSQPTRHRKQPQDDPSHEVSDSPVIRLLPRKQRRVPYVELPPHNSIDLTVYRPVSLASLRMQLFLNQHDRDSRARNCSLGHPGEHTYSAASSTGSEYEDSRDFTHVTKTKGKPRGDMQLRKATTGDRDASGDEGTTCHQCRRKTTKAKMRCRGLRPNSTICPFFYCKRCIEIRYDDAFDSFHPSWHCPYCRGICNCSICLRKAGFGYVLGGSEQLSRVRGRLSIPGHKDRHLTTKPSGKATKKQTEEQTGVSVREWLARKGVIVGTEEWIEERRRQGIRFVIGKTPPAPDAPSPYKEARFNPTLMACTDCFEEDADTPLSVRDSQDDGGTRMSAGPSTCKDDKTGLSSIQIHQSLPPDVRSTSSAINSTAAAHYREDVEVSAFSTSNEDLPGLSSALTRNLRLIIGKSRSGAMGQKRQLPMSNWKVKRLTKSTKQAVDDDMDYKGGQTKKRMVGLPVIRVRGDGLRAAAMSVNAIQVQLDEEEEQGEQGEEQGEQGEEQGEQGEEQGEQEIISRVSTISDVSDSPHHADGHSTPVPSHEPVLVPTESYVPSKLDVTMAKESPMQVGQTYWSFNPVTSRETDHNKQDHDHGLSSLSAPLYSNNDRHLSPQFSMEDGNPAGPSLTASVADATSTAGPQPPPSESTTSQPHSLDDYLNLHMHDQANDDAYLTSTLAAFTSLDETWASLDMAPYSNVDNDMSPLQT